jgi:hypothetical protein
MDRWFKTGSLKKKENTKQDQLQHNKVADGASYFRHQRQITKEM